MRRCTCTEKRAHAADCPQAPKLGHCLTCGERIPDGFAHTRGYSQATGWSNCQLVRFCGCAGCKRTTHARALMCDDCKDGSCNRDH